MMTIPADLSTPVQLYLQIMQRTVDLQREMTYLWTDLLAQLPDLCGNKPTHRPSSRRRWRAANQAARAGWADRLGRWISQMPPVAAAQVIVSPCLFVDRSALAHHRNGA